MKRLAAILSSFLIGAFFAAGVPAARAGGFSPRPIAPPGFGYQWVPPAYQTVSERVWIGERVQMVPEWIEVSPGCFEQALREQITPAHFEFTTRQVLISDGHWQLVEIIPPPVIVSPPVVVIPPPFSPPVVVVPRPDFSGGSVGVDGYGSGGGANLSAFSGLSEWPK